MIYFIKQLRTRPIRIGIAANIDARIRKLQAGSSEKLICLKTIDTENDDLVKQKIYAFFKDPRLEKTGWFSSTRIMQTFLDNLKDKKFYQVADIIYELYIAKESVNKFKIRIDVEQIKKKMATLKYNQSELAKKIGLTRQDISFSFKKKQTSLFTIQKIATVLKCMIQEIVLDD